EVVVSGLEVAVVPGLVGDLDRPLRRAQEPQPARALPVVDAWGEAHVRPAAAAGDAAAVAAMAMGLPAMVGSTERRLSHESGVSYRVFNGARGIIGYGRQYAFW